MGALCLSWLGEASRQEDKHKAPASAPHRPLSLHRWQAWCVNLMSMGTLAPPGVLVKLFG